MFLRLIYNILQSRESYILILTSILITSILDSIDYEITWLTTIKILFFTPVWMITMRKSFLELSRLRFLLAFILFTILFLYTSILIGLDDVGYFTATYWEKLVWNAVAFILLFFIIESEKKDDDGGNWIILFLIIFVVYFYLLDLFLTRILEPNGYKWFLYTDSLLLFFTLFIDFSNWFRYKRKK